MPKAKFVLRSALLLPLLVIAAIAHAMESVTPSGERKLPPSTNFNSLTGNGFASLNAVPTTRGGRADATAAEDMYQFHIPLTGNIQDFGFRLATADGGEFGDLTQQAFFVDFKLPWGLHRPIS